MTIHHSIFILSFSARSVGHHDTTVSSFDEPADASVASPVRPSARREPDG